MILLFMISESVGNIGLSLGVAWPSPDSTVMHRAGTDAEAGPSLDTRIFLNNTYWETGWFAGSWGLSLGFRYFNFQGSWGRGDFYTIPGMAHFRFFNPQDRLRLGLEVAGGLSYTLARWEPPLNDSVSTVKPLSWAGEAGVFLALQLREYVWLEAEAGLWGTTGPVPADLFEPGKDGTRDLVVTGRRMGIGLLVGN